jgi:hypothetical protein
MITNPDAWLRLPRLAKELPGADEGETLNPKVLRRWRHEGLLTPAGERLRLSCRKVGGRWCSTWALVQDFLARIGGDTPTAPIPTRTETRRAAAEADRVLDRFKVGRRKVKWARELVERPTDHRRV